MELTVQAYPQMRFSSSLIGRATNVVFEAAVRERGEELEIEATTTLDQRELGMTYSPLGTIPPRFTLHVDAMPRSCGRAPWMIEAALVPT
jgi:hypothetical protein